jgi:hypothetical protein
MNLYTGMAIDAFRKVEAMKRRLAKAEHESEEAVRRVPLEERDLYALHTELIRFEQDKLAAVGRRLRGFGPKDQESADANDKLIVQYREAIRAEEARLATEPT